MLAGRRNFPNPPTATRPDLQKPQRASELPRTMGFLAQGFQGVSDLACARSFAVETWFLGRVWGGFSTGFLGPRLLLR